MAHQPHAANLGSAAPPALHVRTIGVWVQRGLITPAVRTAGGRYRFRWSEVQEQLRAAQGGDIT